MENWQKVKDFPAYEISDYGSVRRGGKLLKPWLEFRPGKDAGYFHVELWNGGRRHKTTVHQLVLRTFRGPCPRGLQSRHLDGNSRNNHVDNLIWGTHLENTRDRRRHGRKMKLTPELVFYIRFSDLSVRALAKELGCGKSTINYARNGVTWAKF